jgi:hypothetical protein
VAWAETPIQRNQARKLAGEALDLFKAGDFDAALQKFTQADALVPAPTLKVRAARCLDKLGRMREAAERYREVIAIELKPFSPRVHIEAREEAVAELAKLIAATPRLTVLLAGETNAEPRVTIDAKSLGTAVGQEQLLDPGFHSVTVTVGTIVVEKTVTLERGGSEKVVLGLPPAPATADDPAASPVASPYGDGQATSGLATGGWVLTGLGGAGLAVGAIGTALLYRDKGALETQCPTGVCFSDDPAGVALSERFNRERVVASAGLIGGGVLAGAGVSLLVASALRGREGKTSSGEARAVVVPLIGPRFLGISGCF